MKIENKTVVAATASKNVVTLYFDDGETMRLSADAEFTQQVIDKVTPALAAGKTITLNMEDHVLNIYTEMEKKTNGLVKFFRVAKKALLGIDAPTEQQIVSLALPMENYNMASDDDTIVAVIQEEPVNVENTEPVASGEARFPARGHETEVGSQTDPVGDSANDSAASSGTSGSTQQTADSVPATRAEKPAGTVLVGAEALKNQINHFQKQDNPEGFNRFMQRLATVVKARQHTAKELLDFLKHADLPIADDGSIVAYKRLNGRGDHYVDSHSGRVTQRVGSRVFMKPEMVDPDRRNKCSNGLHIGRRDYMRSFSGDKIVIVKIAPEDVIAVPQDYRGSKMRCAGYHIVAEVPKEGFNHLERNDPMTKDSKAAEMLTRVIRGLHDPVDQLVEIRGQKGTDLVITDLNAPAVTEPDAPVELVQETVTQELPVPIEGTQALEEMTDDGRQRIDPALNSPKAIKDKVAKAKAAPEKPAEVVKAEATGDARKVKKAKRKAATKAPEPVKEAPASQARDEMTEHQITAKKRWPAVQAGNLSKVKLAQECKTSTRSLDRWAEKFNF